MNQELVLPKRCLLCGNVFDLSYDFVEGEEPGFMAGKGKQAPRELLCYYCREKQDKPEEKEKNVENEIGFLDEDILDDEDYQD